jgi:hypothetical protein
VPVVVGSVGELHLVDNHHHTTGIYTLSVEYGPEFPNDDYYYTIADFHDLAPVDFWARMVQGGPVLDSA